MMLRVATALLLACTAGQVAGQFNGNPFCDACTRSGGDKPSLQSLTLTYSGGSPTTISVNGVGSVFVSPGDSVTVTPFSVTSSAVGFRDSGMGGSSSGTKLPTNTEFNIGGMSAILHTSCSQPIYIGLVCPPPTPSTAPNALTAVSHRALASCYGYRLMLRACEHGVVGMNHFMLGGGYGGGGGVTGLRRESRGRVRYCRSRPD